jgi:hypothetical protein
MNALLDEMETIVHERHAVGHQLPLGRRSMDADSQEEIMDYFRNAPGRDHGLLPRSGDR